MLARYQNGCLQRIDRKDGVERWQFRWLKKGADGISRERKKTIGTVKDYPENSKKLQDLVAGLRLNINTDGPTELYFDHDDGSSGTLQTPRACRQRQRRQGVFHAQPKDAGSEPLGTSSLGKARTPSHQNRCS